MTEFRSVLHRWRVVSSNNGWDALSDTAVEVFWKGKNGARKAQETAPSVAFLLGRLVWAVSGRLTMHGGGQA
jgi:hypothetical protein